MGVFFFSPFPGTRNVVSGNENGVPAAPGSEVEVRLAPAELVEVLSAGVAGGRVTTRVPGRELPQKRLRLPQQSECRRGRPGIALGLYCALHRAPLPEPLPESASPVPAAPAASGITQLVVLLRVVRRWRRGLRLRQRSVLFRLRESKKQQHEEAK